MVTSDAPSAPTESVDTTPAEPEPAAAPALDTVIVSYSPGGRGLIDSRVPVALYGARLQPPLLLSKGCCCGSEMSDRAVRGTKARNP